MEEHGTPPDSLTDRSLAGMLWVAVDKVGGSGINFIITVLLARMLFPEDFGLVAMAMVFFEFSAVFVESGFSTALIRERTISPADRSTTFIFNMAAALVLYAVLFVCAPWISRFYGTPVLTVVVRIMGLNLILDGLSIVRSSTLIQRVDFRSQAIARFAAVVVSGAVGVAMAYRGFGVWSLVARTLLNSGMLALVLWWQDPSKPVFAFSGASFRRLFGFGSRILLAGLLDKFFSQAYKLVVGKFFAAAALGFYTQAGAFVNMAVNTLFRPVQTVSYPVLSKLQDDRPRLKAAYRTILRMSSFIMFPTLVLLGVLAVPVIAVLISEKWLPAVPYLRLLCVAGATVHISSVNLNMLLVLNRPDLSLRLEIIKKVNIAAAILIGLRFGLTGLVVGEAIVSCVNLLINAYYSRSLIGYRPLEQIGDVLPSLLLSAAAGTAVHFLNTALPAHDVTGLLLCALAGAASYIGLHVACGTREWGMLTGTIVPRTLGVIRAGART